jgi:hypothetical protein
MDSLHNFSSKKIDVKATILLVTLVGALAEEPCQTGPLTLRFSPRRPNVL